MLKRYLYTLLFLFLTEFAYCDTINNDSTELNFPYDRDCAGVCVDANEYKGAQYPHPMLEVGYRNKLSALSFYTKNNTMHLATDLQKQISTYFYWKWVRLGYNFSLGDYNKGFNLDYSMTFGRLNINFAVAQVRNFKLVNKSDYSDLISEKLTDVRLRPFKSKDWNVGVEWMCNRNFAGLSAYDYSYHRQQLKSQSTVVLGLKYSYNSYIDRNEFVINSDSFLIEKQALNRLGSDYNYMYALNLGAGYGYNHVFKNKNLILGILAVPYISAGCSNSYFDSSAPLIGICTHCRTNLTYLYKFGAVSLSGEYNGVWNHTKDFDYTRDLFVFRINHAFRLGNIGLKSCKMPLHRFMDYSTRIVSGGK